MEERCDLRYRKRDLVDNPGMHVRFVVGRAVHHCQSKRRGIRKRFVETELRDEGEGFEHAEKSDEHPIALFSNPMSISCHGFTRCLIVVCEPFTIRYRSIGDLAQARFLTIFPCTGTSNTRNNAK